MPDAADVSPVFSTLTNRQAALPLVEAVGPLTSDQAARVLAIFNRHLPASAPPREQETPDAA
jgi:hypothetical protein